MQVRIIRHDITAGDTIDLGDINPEDIKNTWTEFRANGDVILCLVIIQQDTADNAAS